MIKTYKKILFDLDNTLVDDDENRKYAIKQILIERNEEPNDKRIEDFIKLASVLFNKNMSTLEDLKNEGILTENIYNLIKKDGYITNAQIYVLFSEYVDFIQPNFKEVIKQDKADEIVE